MRLLLNSQALIWWLAGDQALSSWARRAIAEEANDVAVSAVSAMEVSTKFRIGQLPQAALLAHDFEAIIVGQGFAELAIPVRHTRLAGEMNIARPPVDRAGASRRHGAGFQRGLIRRVRRAAPLVTNAKAYL